ncbi:MAG TPA: hypothetical protein VML19_15610 [Verrucomicrobiae bacterium]|nr:hypothetical protein [Verrucomicrobiae bacterium]
MILLSVLLPAGFAAEPDALAIEANILARHLPYGTILDPILSLPDLSQIVDYTRCGDSAIWTGHYLAAEAFRYKVTGSADALTNINNTISAIDNLINVTGGNVLARCALPADSPYAASISSQESANGIYTGTAYGAPWIWVGNTSRDQYIGVFFGLDVTYDMVTDQTVRNWCSYEITRLLENLLDNGWNIEMPDGTVSTTFTVRPDQQLSLLLIGKHVNGGAFGGRYSSLSNEISPSVVVPIGVDCADQTSSYFKFNLDYLTFYTLKRMGSGWSSLWYGFAYGTLRGTTSGHQNAHFNMIDRAINGANSTRDQNTVAYLNEWLLRPRTDVYRNFGGQFVPCSPNEACQPLPVEDRVTTDFLWQRDPFALSGGGEGDIETAGIDYILPYWMARYYGVITN